MSLFFRFLFVSTLFLVAASQSGAVLPFTNQEERYFDLPTAKEILKLQRNDKVLWFVKTRKSRSGTINEHFILGFTESNKILIPGYTITKKDRKKIAFERSLQPDDLALGTPVYDSKKGRTGTVRGYFLDGAYLIKLDVPKTFRYYRQYVWHTEIYDYARIDDVRPILTAQE